MTSADAEAENGAPAAGAPAAGNDIDWESLLRRIKRGTCTPFLGAGAIGDAIPVGSKIARRWAEEFGYPLADSSDLTQVAQFLAVSKKDPLWPKEEIQELFQGYDAPDLSRADHPYAILASLPLPVFLTTNYDDFLTRALRLRGKEPVEEFCRWTPRPSFAARGLVFDDPSFVPTERRPLVYHLHGRIELAESLVLTEDDYVDFLVNMARPDLKIIPPLVAATLAENMLLFIGYRLADWSFRVLYRGLMKTIDPSGVRLNLTVQIDPDEEGLPGSLDDAKQYLRSYFEKLRVQVYWGKAEAFLAELDRQRSAANAP